MAEFTVEFAAVDSAAQIIRTRVRAVETRLDELDRQLSPLRSDWTGSASESYQTTKANWSREIGRMNDLLTRIGRAVETSGSGYRQAEQDNADVWRG